MKVAVIARHDEEEVKSALRKAGLKLSRTPDAVISYGGDGTLLFAEKKFPGVPKAVIKDSHVCNKCKYNKSELEDIIARLKKNEFSTVRVRKLQCGGLLAMNEFQLHNADPTRAVRFSVNINGETKANIIGDGAIICTPFGSTGYYKSAGGKPFKSGIGFVLNNPHNSGRWAAVLPEDSEITINVERGPALLCHDNAGCAEFGDGESVTIRMSKEEAKLLVFGGH